MGTGQYHQMSHVGGCGSKISQKSITYYMNGFLAKELLIKCWMKLTLGTKSI